MRIFVGLFLVCTGAHGAQVIEVQSGDTLTVLDHGKSVTLRLANIDAPELDQAFGKASRASLQSLCKGKQASYQLQHQVPTGENRAAVLCDGIDVSRAQLKRGMAWVIPRSDIDPAFTAIQDFVWRDKTGLWADADPVPPWEWVERNRK